MFAGVGPCGKCVPELQGADPGGSSGWLVDDTAGRSVGVVRACSANSAKDIAICKQAYTRPSTNTSKTQPQQTMELVGGPEGQAPIPVTRRGQRTAYNRLLDDQRIGPEDYVEGADDDEEDDG